MKKHLKDISQEIDDFFSSPPTSNQKAWSLINNFYHLILSYMEEKNIHQSDLARKLGKSRSAISQLFSKTPNISIKKMVEIADAIGIDIEIFSPQIPINVCFGVNKYNFNEFIIDDILKKWQNISTERNRYKKPYDSNTVIDNFLIPSEKINDYSSRLLH